MSPLRPLDGSHVLNFPVRENPCTAGTHGGNGVRLGPGYYRSHLPLPPATTPLSSFSPTVLIFMVIHIIHKTLTLRFLTDDIRSRSLPHLSPVFFLNAGLVSTVTTVLTVLHSRTYQVSPSTTSTPVDHGRRRGKR